jgi:hypothetical protein
VKGSEENAGKMMLLLKVGIKLSDLNSEVPRLIVGRFEEFKHKLMLAGTRIARI